MQNPNDGLPDTPEEFEAWYEAWIAGTAESGWHFLRSASASSYISAADSMSRVAAAWRAGRESGQNDGATAFLLGSNYAFFASGPLLSATLLPAFAIESFVGLGALVALSMNGLATKPLADAQHQFDERPFPERVSELVKLVGAPRMDTQLRRELDALIQFRNACAHDGPLLNAPRGVQLRARKGTVRRVSKTTNAIYPRLTGNNFPLDLSHARRAIAAHDSYVDHVLGASSRGFVESFRGYQSPAGVGPFRIDSFGGSMWADADAFHHYWVSEVVSWNDAVPMRVRTDFLRDLKRRHRVRLAEGGPAGTA